MEPIGYLYELEPREGGHCEARRWDITRRDDYIREGWVETQLYAAPSPSLGEPLRKITDIVDEEVDGYEMRADNGDYTPTDHERALLSDFAYGLIENKDLIAWLVRHHASPTAAPLEARCQMSC